MHKVRLCQDELSIISVGQKRTCYSSRILTLWTPPPVGSIKVNTYGSFLPNSSVMGYLALLRKSSGALFVGLVVLTILVICCFLSF